MVQTTLPTMLMLVGASATPAIAASAFAPGEWQHQTDVVTAEVPGIPQWVIKLIGGHRTRTSCNSAAELSAHPESLFKGDDTAVCQLRRLSLSNGTILFDTFCTNKRFPAGLLVVSQGSYSPTSYSFTTISTGTRNGKPVRIVTRGSGTRLSETCAKP